MLTDNIRLRKPRKILKQINKLAPKMKKMSDEELQNQTQIFRKQLKDGKTLEDILPEALLLFEKRITECWVYIPMMYKS